VFAGAKPARLKVLPGGKKPAKAADIEQRDRKQAADEAAKEVEALSGKLADARRRLAKLRR